MSGSMLIAGIAIGVVVIATAVAAKGAKRLVPVQVPRRRTGRPIRG
jgi:hypothetical protein